MDLKAVSVLCAIVLAKMEAPPREQNNDELEALQAAALVRYGRCFKRGARNAFLLGPESVERIAPAWLEIHRVLIDLRDKHIAHSVNDWELNVPVVYLRHDRETDRYEVNQIQVQHHRITVLAAGTIRNLRQLASFLVEMVESEMRAERSRLLELAKLMPIEELKARLNEPGAIPGRKALDVSR